MGFMHTTPASLAAIAAAFSGTPAPLQASDDGLTLREILAAVPHDPASMVVYGVLGLCVYLVWWAHRHAGGGARSAEAEGAEGKVGPTGAEPGGGPRRAA